MDYGTSLDEHPRSLQPFSLGAGDFAVSGNTPLATSKPQEYWVSLTKGEGGFSEWRQLLEWTNKHDQHWQPLQFSLSSGEVSGNAYPVTNEPRHPFISLTDKGEEGLGEWRRPFTLPDEHNQNWQPSQFFGALPPGEVSGNALLITNKPRERFISLKGEEWLGGWWPLAHGDKHNQKLLGSWLAFWVASAQKLPLASGMVLPPDKQSIAEICDVIRSFSLYQPGWKGEGSVPPPQAEIDNAVKFIEAIPFRIVQPKAMIGSDGDVGFTWRCGDDYLEVGFMEGEMSFCCQKGGEWQYGDFAFTGSIPETLLHSVWRVAGDG